MPFKLLPVGAGIVMLLRATVAPEDPEVLTAPQAVEKVIAAPGDRFRLDGNVNVKDAPVTAAVVGLLNTSE